MDEILLTIVPALAAVGMSLIGFLSVRRSKSNLDAHLAELRATAARAGESKLEITIPSAPSADRPYKQVVTHVSLPKKLPETAH